MFHGKPIIGIAGGIGAGKSSVARMFREFGCLIVDADIQVQEAYRKTEVLRKLVEWWGDTILQADGQANRRLIADRIFADEKERHRLEGLLHPIVNKMRQEEMEAAANDAQILAFVWDTPLLFERGLNAECDAIVFVQSPLDLRLERVRAARGWTRERLLQRENLQWPLDKKREISDYVVVNTADAEYARGQVRDVLSRILARPLQ